MKEEIIKNSHLKVIHEELLSHPPNLKGEGIKVWNIEQDQNIRINLVEMSGKLSRHKH